MVKSEASFYLLFIYLFVFENFTYTWTIFFPDDYLLKISEDLKTSLKV